MKLLLCSLALFASGAAHAAYTVEDFTQDCDKGVSLALITMVEMESLKADRLVDIKRHIAAGCAKATADQVAKAAAAKYPDNEAIMAGAGLVADLAGMPAASREPFLNEVKLQKAFRGDLDPAVQERHLVWMERMAKEGKAFEDELEQPDHFNKDPAQRMRNRFVQLCLFGSLSGLEAMGQSSELSGNLRNQILVRCASDYDQAPIAADTSFERNACHHGADNIFKLQKAKLSKAQSGKLEELCTADIRGPEVIDLEELLH